MRSRELETALRSFLGAAGAHLRAEVASGAEVPFEVGSRDGARRGAGSTLYCYRALTGEFIAERDAAIKRLPGYAEAARMLESFDGLDRYLASVGIDAPRANRRARARAALKGLIEEVFDDQTDFMIQPERIRGALERLHESTLTGARETAIVATLHGMTIASPEVRLTKGLTLARADALSGLPDAVVPTDLAGGEEGHLLVVHRVEDDDAGAALARGRAVLKELLRALRLFGDGRIVLGGIGWMQVGGGSWTPFALAPTRKPRGMLAVTENQEDELRAFCNLVSRRAPRDGELAWALERFELGCERERELSGLSDHLLALRALLEPEGPASCLLPGRIAALCATPPQRRELAERVLTAIALEHEVIAGAAKRDAQARALCEEIATHLKALLRDVICGHLAADLAALADELIARELDDVDGAEPDSPAEAQEPARGATAQSRRDAQQLAST
jgi:hypothetical protein